MIQRLPLGPLYYPEEQATDFYERAIAADLIREATQRAYEIVKVKNPDLPEEKKQEIAEAVAIGAIKYPMLSRENVKIVTFDWQAAMDINGQAAPYIQYAYVRANSILRKVNGKIPSRVPSTYDLETAEVELVNCLSRLPGEVQRAANDLAPLGIANLAYELASHFNNFYTQCPVLQAEEPARSFRLRLVAAAKQAIGNSLALLGITAPEAM
jgi:arginyl-tRNA synthetase